MTGVATPSRGRSRLNRLCAWNVRFPSNGTGTAFDRVLLNPEGANVDDLCEASFRPAVAYSC
jgi:hypothetical protein